jgi:hypothetical protein
MKKAEIKRRKRVIPAPSPFVVSAPPPGMSPSPGPMMDARGLKISLDFAETYPSRPLDMVATGATAPAIAAATAAAAAAAATVTANATGPDAPPIAARAPPSIDFTFFNDRESRTSGDPTRKRPRELDDEEYGRANGDADDKCAHARDHEDGTPAAAADRADARLDPLLRAAGAVADSEREVLRQRAEHIRAELAAVEEALARLERGR